MWEMSAGIRGLLPGAGVDSGYAPVTRWTKKQAPAVRTSPTTAV